MKLTIQTRSGKEVVQGGLELSEDATVDELKRALHAKKKAIYPSRQRFTLPSAAGEKKPTVLEPGKRLADYNIKSDSVITFKDLGPQIGYSTVFFWEYFGPLAVYALIYSLPQIVYYPQKTVEKTLVQKLALAYWTFHYTKRILETFFVHRFSHATMPIANLYRNCSYYWGFAAFVSYFINHPKYTEPPHTWAIALFAGAFMCQVANFWCHVILANLRPPGQTAYVIPRGFLFEFITCPNYTAEVLGWLLFTLATSALPALLFGAAGTFQMLQWAAAKHARLRRTFDGKDGRAKYPKRWIMLPPLF